MSDHPAPYRLEAMAVGEVDADAEAHVEGCEACRKYIGDLLADRSAMLDEMPAAAFLARPEIAAALEQTSAAAQTTGWGWLRWLVPIALVGAAAVIFLVAPPPVEGPGSPEEILYKGGPIAVEVIRQRTLADGTARQSLHQQMVPVRSGDALRVRLKLAKRTQLSAALLADGEQVWMALVTDHWFDSGTQFVPGDALAIGPGPTTGRMVVGAPDAVAAVRNGSADARVIEVHIRAEAAP